MNNILLITDDTATIEAFDDKLMLLRESDRVSYCDYEDAPDIVFENRYDLAIVHENTDRAKTLGLIKYIKEHCRNIILLINNYDRDFVLSAYDEGIDDYFCAKSDPSEMLIRVINCIKKTNLKNEITRYKNYLQEYGVISETNGFVSPKFTDEICQIELKNFAGTGAFIMIAPDEEGKARFSAEKLCGAIKNSVRTGDIAACATGSKYYILLFETGLNGAVSVYEKIKAYLNGQFTIKAGICEIKGLKFKDTEKRAQCALTEALINNQEMVIYADKNDTLDEWLDTPKITEKNYKLFRQIFNKKLEKVIAPVFFRLQKSYEEKLFNTKIEQYTDDNQSVFCLKNPKQESRLKIVYPGFAKIIIYITHAGLESPENREISMPLNKISQKELIKIVEDFIKEFKSTID